MIINLKKEVAESIRKDGVEATLKGLDNTIEDMLEYARQHYHERESLTYRTLVYTIIELRMHKRRLEDGDYDA